MPKKRELSVGTTGATEVRKLPAVTMHARYVFLDIMGFTHNRSVEAQTDLVKALNQIVKGALVACGVKRVIVLPTGDGMCIAIESPTEMDIHLRVAMKVLADLAGYNQTQTDQSRQFKLRIGVNENDDNVVTDFNGKRNLAGAGINMAQRIMSTADENQIMLGQPVFEILRHRESYIKAFRSYHVVVKHGFELPVHQLIVDSPGLNVDIPSRFKANERKEKPLSKLIAYYMALAIRSRKFIVSVMDRTASLYTAKVLLWLLAQDYLGFSEATDSNPYDHPKTWNVKKATLADQFDYYYKADFWLMCDFSKVVDGQLAPYNHLFSSGVAYGFEYLFPSKTAAARIRSEFPQIWNEFDLEEKSVVDPK